MSERKSLIAQVRDAGQAVVAAAAIAGLMGGFAVKAWGWASAGPIALTKAQKLEKEVRRLKRRSNFMIRAAEKTLREPYDWRQEENEISSPLVEPE